MCLAPSVRNLFLASFILQPARNYKTIATMTIACFPFFSSLQAVQPDQLCKLKTILAVDYIQDILETNRVSVTDHKFSPLKISKRGQLKPLLFVKQLDKPQITKCLGIQSGRFI